jgi:hypothetical protein
MEEAVLERREVPEDDERLEEALHSMCELLERPWKMSRDE